MRIYVGTAWMLSATNYPNYLNTSEPLYTLEHKAIGLRYDYYSETFRNLAKDWANYPRVCQGK